MRDIKFECRHCGQHLEAPADMMGEDISCPACSKMISVPAASAQTAAAESLPSIAPPSQPVGPARAPELSSAMSSAPARADATVRRMARPVLLAGVGLLTVAAVIGLAVRHRTHAPLFSTGPSDEFCGTWKVARTTPGTEPFTRTHDVYAQPVTIEKLAAAMQAKEDDTMKSLYVLRRRGERLGVESSIIERHGNEISWKSGDMAGSQVFSMDDSQLKLSWIMSRGAQPLEAWFEQVSDPDILTGEKNAPDKSVQRTYAEALRTIEMHEMREAHAREVELDKTVASGKTPGKMMVTRDVDAMLKCLELELLYAGELVVPSSQPAIRVPMTQYRETAEELLEVAPPYRDRVVALLKRCVMEQSRRADGGALDSQAEETARQSRDLIFSLDFDAYEKLAIAATSKDTSGFASGVLEFLGRYDPVSAQALRGIFAQPRMTYTKWWYRRGRQSGKPASDWDKALARQIVPTVLETFKTQSSEALCEFYRPMQPPVAMVLFLQVLPAYESPEITQREVELYRAAISAYAGSAQERRAASSAGNALEQWHPMLLPAMRHPDKLLDLCTEHAARNSNLGLALLLLKDVPEDVASRAAQPVCRRFAQVVLSHAEKVGVASRMARSRPHDFRNYWREQWPPLGIDWILVRFLNEHSSVLEGQDDLTFAVDWSCEQLRTSPFADQGFGKHGLMNYLSVFPTGKYAALAREWTEAK